jgi:hypothetical protein
MATVSLKTYLDHMDLKNWAFSLFDSGHPLHTYGFKYRRATPSIIGETKIWTPDLIVWSDRMILIIECKGGKPTDEDLFQAKTYADIPESVLSTLTGISGSERKVVLMYFKDMLESDLKMKETLLAKSVLEKDILIWVCEKGFSVTLVQGSHGENELDSLMNGGIDLPHFLGYQIEIQPDSPTALLEKLLFTKLWERAFRYKDTRFTLGTAREILENQNYASKNPDRRLNDAINSGEKHGLCNTEQPGQVWKLNFILGSPPSIQNYLRKLKDVLNYPELQEFSMADK